MLTPHPRSTPQPPPIPGSPGRMDVATTRFYAGRCHNHLRVGRWAGLLLVIAGVFLGIATPALASTSTAASTFAHAPAHSRSSVVHPVTPVTHATLAGKVM